MFRLDGRRTDLERLREELLDTDEALLTVKRESVKVIRGLEGARGERAKGARKGRARGSRGKRKEDASWKVGRRTYSSEETDSDEKEGVGKERVDGEEEDDCGRK